MRTSTRGLRILLVGDKPGAAARLKAQLETLGHHVIGSARDHREAIVSATRLRPDFVMIELRLDGLDGIRTARTIFANQPLPIVLLAGHSAAEFVPRAHEAGIMAALVTPTSAPRCAAIIDVALERFREFQAIRLETVDLHEALALRNDIERAKRVLMTYLDISEADAFRRLWRTRTGASSLRELAVAVSKSEPLLKDGCLVRSVQSVITAIGRRLNRTHNTSANGRTSRVTPSSKQLRTPNGR
ncbi:MAG TPA: response regulator [Vicinamibacterales bacterium]|jgi:response regulator NasT